MKIIQIFILLLLSTGLLTAQDRELWELAESKADNGESKDAIKLFRVISSDDNHSDIMRAEAYNRIGLINREMGNLDSAIVYFNKSLSTAPNDTLIFIASNRNIAELYNIKGLHHLAKNILQKNIVVSLSCSDPNTYLSYFEIASNYISLASKINIEEYSDLKYTFLDSASAYIKKSVFYLSQFNNDSVYKSNKSHIEALYGMIKYYKHNYTAALGYFHEALESSKNGNNIQNIASYCNNIADIYIKTGKGDFALKYLGLAIINNANDYDLEVLANTHYNYGKCYSYFKEVIASNKHLDTALVLYSKLKNTQYHSEIFLIRGRNYYYINDLATYNECIEKSLSYQHIQNANIISNLENYSRPLATVTNHVIGEDLSFFGIPLLYWVPAIMFMLLTIIALTSKRVSIMFDSIANINKDIADAADIMREIKVFPTDEKEKIHAIENLSNSLQNAKDKLEMLINIGSFWDSFVRIFRNIFKS
jgi:tetratricopeptide (TPR) repeat protein